MEMTSQNSLLRSFQVTWLRFFLFALIWWILTDGSLSSWLVGAPVVLFATWVSVKLLPVFSFSLKGFLEYIPFFLWNSLVGGIDVAQQALQPRLQISPQMHAYRWRLPPGLSRVLMANTVSLLPGTLSAELDDEHLTIHVLDKNSDFVSDLIKIEQRVANIFGLTLSPIESND